VQDAFFKTFEVLMRVQQHEQHCYACLSFVWLVTAFFFVPDGHGDL
jgi:hypothetical protein